VCGQGWTIPGERLIAREHVPHDDRQFACRRDNGDLLAATVAYAQEESAQRAGRLCCAPGCLDEQSSRVRTSPLGDVTVPGGRWARLIDRRVQPEVAHQLLRIGKPFNGADCRQQADCHSGIDAGDGQQPAQPLVADTGLRQGLVDLVQILPKTVQLPQALLDAQTLVHRQRLGREPYASLPAEQISSGAPLDQMRSQHRMNFVLQPRALPHEL
jgi:hypothetical protein